MIVRLTRLTAFTAGALGGFAVSQQIDWSEQIGIPETLVIILLIILGCAIGYLFGGILGRELDRWYDRLDERLRATAAADLLLGTVGIIAGLLIAILIASPLRLIEPAWVSFVATTALTVVLAYGFMRVALLKRMDFADLFGKRIGAAIDDEPLSRLKVVDTSAVIDGRLPDLVRIGAVEGRVVVPAFVLSELQTLADSADDLKRARGRRGLDLLETMRGGEVGLEIFTVDYADTPDVDSKLLRLSRDTGGTLVTVDYNLTKVARVQGVSALNLNEIANALRPNVAAGDELRIDIVRVGKEAGQGVGYLEDGTMVVVESASERVGDTIEIVVTSIFQASAGRMVFAKAGDVR